MADDGTPMPPGQARLVEDNVKLAYHIAHKYFRGASELISFDDLAAEAMYGLVRAAQTFDPAKGRFSTYAGLCISNSILLAIRRTKAWQLHYVPLEDLRGEGKDGDPGTLDHLRALRTYDNLYDGSEELLTAIVIRRWRELPLAQRPLVRRYLQLTMAGDRPFGEQLAREFGFSRSYPGKVLKPVLDKVRSDYYGLEKEVI